MLTAAGPPGLASPPVRVPTRVAALVMASAAVACLAAAGGLDRTWVPLSAVAMALAELGAVSSGGRRANVARSVLLPAALVVATTPAVLALLHAAGDPTAVREAGARLAAGALIVLPLAGATRRDHLTRFTLGGATAGLAMSLGGSAVLVPGLLFAAAALVLLALLERDRIDVGREAGRSTRRALSPALPSQHAAAAGQSSAPGPRRRSPGPALAVVALAAVLAGIVASVADLPPAPSVGRSGGGDGGAGSASSSSGGTRLAGGSTTMDLRNRGSLSDSEVARVSTAEPLLWRTGIYTRYAAGSWRASADSRVADVVPGPGRQDTVTLAERADPLLLSPGELRDLQPRAARPDGYGHVVRVPRGSTYTVTSAVPSVPADDATPVAARADELGSGVGATGPVPEVTADELSVGGITPRVARLAAELTAGTRTREQAVDAVVAHLRTTYRYRLDSPVPTAGTDPVEDFLFGSREGFCEQFASAAALLLRSTGVPARIAVGYADGTSVDGGRVLRGTDAHAWVEVAFPGRGWVAFDPTAGTVRADAVDGALVGWLRGHGAPAALLALFGAALATAVVTGATLLLRRRREAHLDPLEAALARLDRRLGGNGRRPEETWGEFADRIRLDRRQRAALTVVERLRFAAVPPDANETSDAAAVLRQAARRRR